MNLRWQIFSHFGRFGRAGVAEFLAAIAKLALHLVFYFVTISAVCFPDGRAASTGFVKPPSARTRKCSINMSKNVTTRCNF